VDIKNNGKRINILVLTYWDFSDALVQTYTLPYLDIIREQCPGSRIWLLTQDHRNHDEHINQIKEKKLKNHIRNISVAYVPFGFRAAVHMIWLLLKLAFLIKSKRINFIHTFGTPPGVLGYLLSVIFRLPLILDSYEPHAEAMVENGTWSGNSFAFRFLFLFEKLQSKRARTVISATYGMKEYALRKYGVSFNDNFYVKPACVDLDLFSLEKKKNPILIKELGLENKIVGVYAGKFGGIYLDREVFAFLREAVDFWGEQFRFLLLSNLSDQELNERLEEFEIPKSSVIKRFVHHAEIPDYMGLADFGITPVKPIPTKRYCTPIKDGEYWAMGLPVIITKDISDDSEIIENEGIGYVWKDLTEKEVRQSVVSMNETLKSEPGTISKRIRMIAKKYRSFDNAGEIYKLVYC
jgi:glycosyltransferase involved in cell wall biosynthesis